MRSALVNNLNNDAPLSALEEKRKKRRDKVSSLKSSPSNAQSIEHACLPSIGLRSTSQTGVPSRIENIIVPKVAELVGT